MGIFLSGEVFTGRVFSGKIVFSVGFFSVDFSGWVFSSARICVQRSMGGDFTIAMSEINILCLKYNIHHTGKK